MRVPLLFLSVAVSSVLLWFTGPGPVTDVLEGLFLVLYAVAVVALVRTAGGRPSQVLERLVVGAAALGTLGPVTVALMDEGFPAFTLLWVVVGLGVLALLVTVFQDAPRRRWVLVGAPVATWLGGYASMLVGWFGPLVDALAWTAAAVVVLRWRGQEGQPSEENRTVTA